MTNGNCNTIHYFTNSLWKLFSSYWNAQQMIWMFVIWSKPISMYEFTTFHISGKRGLAYLLFLSQRSWSVRWESFSHIADPLQMFQMLSPKWESCIFPKSWLIPSSLPIVGWGCFELSWSIRLSDFLIFFAVLIKGLKQLHESQKNTLGHQLSENKSLPGLSNTHSGSGVQHVQIRVARLDENTGSSPNTMAALQIPVQITHVCK